MFEHDFQKFPELTNAQLTEFGLFSPHAQITEDFSAEVLDVHDGDTVTLRTDSRNFDFPLRFLKINAPELSEEGGTESRDFLTSWIKGKEVFVQIDKKNRVDKYGRLLGDVLADGMSVNDMLVVRGYAKPFEQRNEGKIADFDAIVGSAAI